MQHVTYGPGGYDPTKMNDNIVSVEEVPDPPEVPTADDRLAALEEQNAALLDALATAPNLAAIRAAAINAKERTRRAVTEPPSVRDSPRE